MATVVYASERWEWNNIHFITYNKSLIKFCEKLSIEYTIIEQNYNFSMKGLFMHKRYIKRISKVFNNKEILFCFYGFDVWGLFLMKHLNRLYHMLDAKKIKSTLIIKTLILRLLITHQNKT